MSTSTHRVRLRVGGSCPSHSPREGALRCDQLVLVNPIGLENWKALGVPGRTVDQWHERELKLSADSVRRYETATYYVGQWKPEYERWVDMLAGLNQGPGHKAVAWNSALIYDMIFTQPIVYEFPLLKMPTLLMIGDADTTAIASDIASPEVKARIGHYDVPGKEVVKLVPQGQLIEFLAWATPLRFKSRRSFIKHYSARCCNKCECSSR